MERARINSNQKLTPAVAFPSSYPFSLLATLPESPRPGKSSMPHETVFIPGLGEIAIVILSLILSTPKKMMLAFLDDSLGIEGPERFVSLLTQFFAVATSVLDYEAFPPAWLNANVLAHKVLIRMLEPITSIMESNFIPPQEEQASFRADLWRQCFGVLLKLLSSDQLVIEEFSPQVRVPSLARVTRSDAFARNGVPFGVWQATSVGKERTSYCICGNRSAGLRIR